jgi:hypothetical protein
MSRGQRLKTYLPVLSAVANRKGVLDVDTVKGCTLGMKAYPYGGCYGLCYACKMARARGLDFTRSVSREPQDSDRPRIERTVRNHPARFFRVGVMGDPCHDWPLTLEVCEWLGKIKTPVIITKHWVPVFDSDIPRLIRCGAVVNTSISALDTPHERAHRLEQFLRLKDAGVRSVLRIVSARFGDTDGGRRWARIQADLFLQRPTLDNPLRIPATDLRVKDGDILIERRSDLGGGSTISVRYPNAYTGPCSDCADQCGINMEGV